MKTAPARLAGGVEGRPREAAGQGEGAHPISRMRWRRSGAACRGWLLRRSTASRPRWFGEPHRRVRGPPPADRLPRLLRAGGHDLLEGGSYPQRACVGCSFVADQVSNLAHLNGRTRRSRSPRAPPGRDPRPEGAARDGSTSWYTITDDFDKDFDVDEWHGHNAFIREGDRIYRTYFIEARGDEAMGTTWSYLDLSALGRQEVGGLAGGRPQTPPYQWWKYNDAYGT